MSEPRPPILSRIEAAFEPYLKPQDEVLSIRNRIAKYLDSISPPSDASSSGLDTFTIPSHITGVRRRYLQARYDNLKAKLEYAQLRETAAQHHPQVTAVNGSTRVLEIHCELLRLRKQHQRYQILSHYANEARNLANKHQLFEGHPKYNLNATDYDKTGPIDNAYELARVRELTRNLEVAVIQANHELKRERQLLENVRSHAHDHENASLKDELRALLTTKDVLTAWIEDSLAQCDVSAQENTSNTLDQAQHHDPSSFIPEVEGQYERYIQARSQLLDAASAVMAPQPTETSSAELAIMKQPTRTTSQTNITASSPSPTSVLPYIESYTLPLHHQSTALSHSQSQLDQLLFRHTNDLHEQLLRLNDESHLLPSYPILKHPIQEQSETEKLLRAWKFAMEAAGTATGATVERQIAVGQRAVDEADAVLEGQDEMGEIWKKLETR